MLTADAAVDSITRNAPKQAIWSINTEESYHEEAYTRPMNVRQRLPGFVCRPQHCHPIATAIELRHGVHALAMVLNYAFGKEMAWDLLHYHFYSGFSALNDRFEQDYFAAGPFRISTPTRTSPFTCW